MITDPDQIQALIESTETLIEEDGMDISVQRVQWERTPAGGVRRVGDSTPQPPVRRFFGAASGTPPRVIRDEGEQLVVSHVLVGMPGDDIKEKDTFSVGARKFEVVEMDPNTSWHSKGWCVERA